MKRIIGVLALCAVLWAAIPSSAWAFTGDDPNGLPNYTSPEETATYAGYDQWVNYGLPAMPDGPYKYLYTQTCPQERAYWCGPAATQTVLTFFGLKPSQATLAARLGTTTNGTPFSRVDDVLRAYTTAKYAYASMGNSSAFYNHVVYSLLMKDRPIIVDVRIRAPWGPYRKDHAGHIIALDCFDWRSVTVRLDDSYDEEAWQTGGGDTGGHVTYNRSLVWNALALHPAHAIVF
jgi:hypothetical protein